MPSGEKARSLLALRAGSWLSGAWAAIYLIAATAILTRIDVLSSGEDPLFSRGALNALALTSILLSGVLAITSVTLYRRSPVARVWILLFWAGLQLQVILVGQMNLESFTVEDLSPSLLLLISAAYLYFGEDSRVFFRTR